MLAVSTPLGWMKYGAHFHGDCDVQEGCIVSEQFRASRGQRLILCAILIMVFLNSVQQTNQKNCPHKNAAPVSFQSVLTRPPSNTHALFNH